MAWAGGGGQPRWRADGKELFYIMGNDTMLSVEVETEGAFKYGAAKKLFSLLGMRGNFPEEAPCLQKYDVSPGWTAICICPDCAKNAVNWGR